MSVFNISHRGRKTEERKAVLSLDHAVVVAFDKARREVAECRTVIEAKEIRDKAQAMQAYAKVRDDLGMIQDATAIRFAAEDKMGELLATSPKAEGTRPDGSALHCGHRSVTAADSRLPPLSAMGVTKRQSAAFQRYYRLPVDQKVIRVNHAVARIAGMATTAPGYPKMEFSGENEWFTPADWIERVRAALGEIDLDPASHPLAQKTVQAKQFFTVADDGLSRQWTGRVWLNPPYSRELISPFINKLVAEFERGRVTQAIMLTHNYTDTGWFYDAARGAELTCFPQTRIRFLSPAGDECSPTQGQAFHYFGQDATRFRIAFAGVGLMGKLR